MITIRFSGRVPSPRTIEIGQETDSSAEKLRFLLPQVGSGQAATLQMIFPDGTADAINITDGMITLPASAMDQAGRIRAWVEILAENTVAWHSELFYLDVGELPVFSEAVEQQYPTAFQDTMAQTTENRRKAEAWAVGQRDGTDVESTDESYQNNAKYYSQQGAASAEAAAASAAAAAESEAAATASAENAAASEAAAAASESNAAASELAAETSETAAAGSAAAALASETAAAGSAADAAGFALEAAGSAEDAAASAAAADASAEAAAGSATNAAESATAAAGSATAAAGSATAAAGSATAAASSAASAATAGAEAGTSAAEAVVSELKSALTSLDDGSYDTDLMGFAVGTISTTGVFSDATKYRIATPDIFTPGIDLFVKPLTGYRLYIIYYDSGTTIINRIGWIQVPVILKSGIRVKICVARVTEDTYEVVTVSQLLAGVEVQPYSNYTKNTNLNAVYTGNYSELFVVTGGVLLGNYSVGDVVDISPLNNFSPTTGSSGIHCTVLINNIVEGEVYTINSTDGNTVRPWAFLDKDYKLISMADGAYASNITLTVPNNAVYFIAQVGAASYNSAKLSRKLNFDNISDDFAEEKGSNYSRWIKTSGAIGLDDGNYKPQLTLSGSVPLGNYSVANTVDMSPLRSVGSHYTVLIDGVIPYETFLINAIDGNTARPWAFLDKDNKLLSMCDGATANNVVLKAPENSQYLLIQVGTADESYYTNAYILRLNNVLNATNGVSHICNGNYKTDLRKTSSVLLGNYSVGDVVDISPLFVAGNQHYTLLISDVVPGEEFYLNSTDGSTARPWAFLDKDLKLLSMAGNAYANNVILNAPENAQFLIVQVGSVHYTNAKIIRYNSFTDYDKNTGINALNKYSDIINKLENASNISGYNESDTNTSVKSRANLLNLIHFSDIHGDTTNISRLIEFYNLYNSYIHGVLHTGDSVTTYYGDANPFATVGGDEVMNVIGNHDCWIQGATWPSPYNATAQQAYEKFIAPYINNWGVTSPGVNLCYYYKDYSTAKTRVIVLDCIHYDSTQETWFAGVLADAITNELRVIAVTHYPAQTGLTGIDCTFNSLTKTIDAVATPPAGTQIERMPESAFTAVDTFINNGGEFVCWLSGHTHDDFIGVVNNHTNQIQVIVSTGGTSNRYSDCARTKNTKTEDLFNVFTIDGNAKLIKLIRVGSTMDEFMRKRETLCVNYATRQVVSNN